MSTTAASLSLPLSQLVDDVPRLWFTNIRGSVDTIKPREVLKNQIPLPDNSSQLPDNLPSVFDDLTLADDKQTILSKGNNTGIKLDDVSDYLDGDPFTGKAPRIREFYRKLGFSEETLANSKVLSAAFDEIDVRFVRTEAYQQGARLREAQRISEQYTKEFGNTPEGLKRFAEKYPENFEKLIDEMSRRDSAFKNLIESNADLKKTVSELKAATKLSTRKKILYAVSVIVGLAALAGIVYSAVRDYQIRNNGCRLYDNNSGLGDKIELLTCDDKLVNIAKNDKIKIRSTCVTQPYTVGQTQPINACTTETFNPCLGIAKNRSGTANLPTVPDVCDTYLYRKSLGSLDTTANIQRIDACATMSADDTCSAKYCNKEAFGNEFLKAYPNTQLKCVNYSWSQAFVGMMLDWGKDVACMVLPFGCDTTSPPSTSWFPSWLKYVLMGALLLAIVGFVGYKFVQRSKMQNAPL